MYMGSMMWTLPPSMLDAKIFSDQTIEIADHLRLQALLNSSFGDFVITVLMKFYDGVGSNGYCFYSQFGENKSLLNTSGFNYSDDMVFDRQQCEGMIRAFKTH